MAGTDHTPGVSAPVAGDSGAVIGGRGRAGGQFCPRPGRDRMVVVRPRFGGPGDGESGWTACDPMSWKQVPALRRRTSVPGPTGWPAASVSIPPPWAGRRAVPDPPVPSPRRRGTVSWGRRHLRARATAGSPPSGADAVRLVGMGHLADRGRRCARGRSPSPRNYWPLQRRSREARPPSGAKCGVLPARVRTARDRRRGVGAGSILGPARCRRGGCSPNRRKSPVHGSRGGLPVGGAASPHPTCMSAMR